MLFRVRDPLAKAVGGVTRTRFPPDIAVIASTTPIFKLRDSTCWLNLLVRHRVAPQDGLACRFFSGTHPSRFGPTFCKPNYKTQFAQTASELSAFRDAVADLMGDMDNTTLCDTFRKTVQLTTYDAYLPLVSKLSKSPCRESEVVDLLAPGLPDYITKSSSTSGGVPKAFPKYNGLPTSDVSESAEPSTLSNSPRRTTAFVFSFIREPLSIIDENDRIVKTVHVPFTSSSVVWRSVLGLHPENDEDRMATFLSDFAAPYAAGFVKTWTSFLVIQGLFALGSRSLKQMKMSFVTTFVELIRHIDAHFDMMTDCIANGTIPDLDRIEHVRHHLEGGAVWLGQIYARSHVPPVVPSSLPLARSFLGSSANILARGYGCSECQIASPYNPFYLEYYKPIDQNIIEFLDLCENESFRDIVQPWEVGKRYEVVMTISDGLWRYRVGDIVEIAGFVPDSGTPVIRFIERRSVAIRFETIMIRETELRSAMMSVAENTLVNVVEWTATLDERHIPRTIGFFVELASERVCNAAPAREGLLEALSRSNVNVMRAHVEGMFGKPTVWVVERGTFTAFRQLKLDEGSNNIGQVKVPVVLPKPAYVTWFLGRVVKEL